MIKEIVFEHTKKIQYELDVTELLDDDLLLIEDFLKDREIENIEEVYEFICFNTNAKGISKTIGDGCVVDGKVELIEVNEIKKGDLDGDFNNGKW